MAATFHLPHSVAEALELLALPEARALAGGASLVAMMNARLVAPAAVVSLKNIPALRGIRQERDGAIVIGAMTRHRETAADARLTGMLACLRAAAARIGNPVIRNMGTMGGSVSLADPGADYPAALVAADAVVQLEGRTGTRRISARKFFLDWYGTAARPDELITAVLLPPPSAGIGCYHKLARVAGDFAIASVALCVSARGEASVAIGGCGPTPIFSAEANAMVSQRIGDTAAALRAGELLARLADPVDDVRASAEYRRLVIPRLLERALRAAASQRDLAA